MGDGVYAEVFARSLPAIGHVASCPRKAGSIRARSQTWTHPSSVRATSSKIPSRSRSPISGDERTGPSHGRGNPGTRRPEPSSAYTYPEREPKRISIAPSSSRSASTGEEGIEPTWSRGGRRAGNPAWGMPLNRSACTCPTPQTTISKNPSPSRSPTAGGAATVSFRSTSNAPGRSTRSPELKTESLPTAEATMISVSPSPSKSARTGGPAGSSRRSSTCSTCAGPSTTNTARFRAVPTMPIRPTPRSPAARPVTEDPPGDRTPHSFVPAPPSTTTSPPSVPTTISGPSDGSTSTSTGLAERDPCRL